MCFAPVLTMSEAADAPAQRRARRRSSRSTASCQPAPGAALLAARRPRSQRPPSHAGPAHRRGPRRLGLRRRRDRQAPRGRRRQVAHDPLGRTSTWPRNTRSGSPPGRVWRRGGAPSRERSPRRHRNRRSRGGRRRQSQVPQPAGRFSIKARRRERQTSLSSWLWPR